MLIAVSLMLSTFGYGGVATFSAVYADAIQVEPKSIYLTTLATIVLFTRPFAGRLADRVGYKPPLLPAFACVGLGLALLAFAETQAALVVSALVFGLGFGTAYPIFTAYVMQHMPPARRGAAFGSMITAFDIGIGTGSISLGWFIQTVGFSTAFGVAAVVSGLALPYFIVVDWWMYGRQTRASSATGVGESA